MASVRRHLQARVLPGLVTRACGQQPRLLSAAARFSDPWFRQYDKPTDGFVDSAGFMSRLPIRLESSNMFLYGTVDAARMWEDYADEDFVPILVGGKAIVNVWFNNFTDTDCGGEYLETWYNTFVTTREEQLELPMESPFSALIQDPRMLIFLQRVICGDTARNPGAAMKAITGGRSVWGFPKHPVPASLRYGQSGKTVEFDGSHSGKEAVRLRVQVPEGEGAVTIPMDVKSGPDQCIGSPRLGGTHKGDNGAHQVRYGQAFRCTQVIQPWDPSTDSLAFGEDPHYALPIRSWGFEPLLKAHTTDMKIVAFKPSNWISGSEAARIFGEQESKLAAGGGTGRGAL